jgi:hypothetical protein
MHNNWNHQDSNPDAGSPAGASRFSYRFCQDSYKSITAPIPRFGA